MSRVRGKDTGTEKVVRSLIHRLGYRFRLYTRDLPGSPDIVFPSRRKVIFVHGCFWHGHGCPRGKRMPAANAEYWGQKIARNKLRDRRNRQRLRRLGWDPLIIWECKVKQLDTLKKQIESFLSRGKKLPLVHSPIP